ncbi:MAG: GDP-mannose 4,6-dehydratase [Candidatus Vogelbacteria bacterium CG10_big_fil_rev_8_21_14_0_10_49_38]|uniref:GDP-mannose 4,6-dehydratase n=1 Tax=Candidatus Vogelbacteria bacterium CG10_big_fil_rev_8_21_14_0_10_49_38 TaxID=1975043 RepID=A0A2H0RI03_9BACT|nr:MAG: hypothetical protein BK006_01720 [bacterium CG10_49_38]PIR46113.1 MAG: GDP-mannose 4,6-dehydratase [Candidatus Vogelbacteria bacterium CG10_big_fil_rev_8_21_14_0_10_49_38]
MAKTALITGITGQDGAYLAKLLLEKGYRIYGFSRLQNPDLSNLKYLKIENQVEVKQGNLLSAKETKEKIADLKPQEIYNLSAQSSVDYSFRQPAETMTDNVNSVINLLEAIRQTDREIKFYQATSCEIYGQGNTLPITETSPLSPSSPYGVSKAAGHLLVGNYRQTYGLYCASGILFNHESPLRRPEFFIRRLIRTARNIRDGADEYLYLGQADNRRDFGWSPDYVEAMRLMLQQATPEDYIICSGRSVSIREIAEYVLTKFNLPTTRIKIDEKLFRSPNIPDLYGDPTKAREKLGWKYDKSFFEVLDILIEEELEHRL